MRAFDQEWIFQPCGEMSPDAKSGGIGGKESIVGWLLLLLAAIGVGALLKPRLAEAHKAAALVEVIGHSKHLHLALIEFDKDYGKFPDGDTISAVRSRTHTDLWLGTASSNDFMRQLLAAGQGNEEMFYAPFEGARKPDGSTNEGRALEKGECGFAYIPGLSSKSDGNCPLVISPLIRGTDQVDTKALDGKVVVMTIDGSATTGEVDDEGHVVVFGKRLLDPSNPVWEGRPPLIAWPQ